MITILFFIAAAGVCALGRSLVIDTLNTKQFPSGTLVVNVLGSLVGALILSRVPTGWATVTGFAALGSFTTFSTFAVETAALWDDHRQVTAIVYALATTGAAVGAAFIGLSL